jgi:hypothetical protein
VIGEAVRGGQIYGTMPSLELANVLPNLAAFSPRTLTFV